MSDADGKSKPGEIIGDCAELFKKSTEAANLRQRDLFRLINGQFARTEKDIRRERERRALATTVDYVEEHMPNVQSVRNWWEVHDIAAQSISVEDGLCLEFGVFEGRTINHIAKLVKSEVYGFDSFEGLPQDWRDGFPRGKFHRDGLPEVADNVRLYTGLFSDVLPEFLQLHPQRAAYIHVDCDLYSSSRYVLRALTDRIQRGTVIVFDEYFNYPGWTQGEFRAFQEFVRSNNIKYRYITYNSNNEQVAVQIL